MASPLSLSYGFGLLVGDTCGFTTSNRARHGTAIPEHRGRGGHASRALPRPARRDPARSPNVPPPTRHRGSRTPYAVSESPRLCCRLFAGVDVPTRRVQRARVWLRPRGPCARTIRHVVAWPALMGRPFVGQGRAARAGPESGPPAGPRRRRAELRVTTSSTEGVFSPSPTSVPDQTRLRRPARDRVGDRHPRGGAPFRFPLASGTLPMYTR